MAVKRVTLSVIGIQGPSNPALIGFTYSGGGTDADLTANAILYLASAAAQGMASCYVNDASVLTAGAAGSVPQPFPTAEYASQLVSLAGPNTATTVMTAYAVPIGGGNIAPLGSSIVVSERTATTGRTGKGRHFLPYVSMLAVTTTGFLAAANAANIALSYQAVLGGSGFFPVVCPKDLTAPKLVTSVVAQPVLSNLRSRRR